MAELQHLSGAIRALSDPAEVMSRVVDQALELVPAAEGATVALAGDELLTYHAAAGALTGQLGGRLAREGSLIDAVLTGGQTVRCDDVAAEPHPDARSWRHWGAASAVIVPLGNAPESVGALILTARHVRAFVEADAELLSGLAEFVGTAVASVWELSRVTGRLLRGGARGAAAVRGDGWSGGCAALGPDARDRMARFVAGVLRPGVVAEAAARERVQRVLDGSGFQMRCQPIVELDGARLSGAEALARFPRARESAEQWFADADRVGLGVALQLAAVRAALTLVDALPTGVYLTINVGPDAIAAPALAQLLARVDPRRLVLEITEHLRIDDYPGLHARLSTLRSRGTRLAVDDTGAGFSSFGHIVNLSPDLIKLDRQFTHGIDGDPVRRALARAFVGFAAETGAEVVAEGIETAAELETMRDLGVHYGQGYFIGRPVPVHALPDRFVHVGASNALRPRG